MTLTPMTDIGNNADSDDDDDGVADTDDAFPLDSTEFEDTDSDGMETTLIVMMMVMGVLTRLMLSHLMLPRPMTLTPTA